jgi:hypothetical protein
VHSGVTQENTFGVKDREKMKEEGDKTMTKYK